MTAIAGLPAVSDEERLLAKAPRENFPVALRLLPRRRREDLLAVYAFARLVDDLGDELDADAQGRLAALDEAEAELDRAYAGTATSPVFLRLSATIERCCLPRQLFADLIEANRLDQTVHRYATFDDLLGYCARSANPVGRLVLHVFGELGASSPDAELTRLSDLVCSGLQVVEHLQDMSEDAERGRVYVPTEDFGRLGVDPEHPATWTDGAGAASPATRRLVALESSRARSMLEEGARLVGHLRDRGAVLAVSGFAGGGLAQLAAIEEASYDVLASPVRASNGAVARTAAAVLLRGRMAPAQDRPRRPRGGSRRGRR